MANPNKAIDRPWLDSKVLYYLCLLLLVQYSKYRFSFLLVTLTCQEKANVLLLFYPEH